MDFVIARHLDFDAKEIPNAQIKESVHNRLKNLCQRNVLAFGRTMNLDELHDDGMHNSGLHAAFSLFDSFNYYSCKGVVHIDF